MTTPRMQDKRFRQMLDAAPDAMVVVDQRGSIVAVNREAERLFGSTDAELRGEPSSQVIPQRFQQVYEALGVSDGKSPEIPPKRAPVRIFARRRDGSEFPVEIHRSPLGPSEDALFLVTMRDLTEWRDVQESLFRQKEQAIVALASIADAVVTTDVAGRITYLNPTAERLTGWRTTEALGQPVARVLAEAAAGVAEHVLCYLDLDRFKLVNDSCGHEAGDDLLCRISRLLSGRLRSRDTLARLGGDEFGVLLEYCSLTKAEEIAGKLERAIAEFRYTWGERSFSLGVSIGVVAITAASGRTADVLRAADEACYAAKDAGGNRVHVAQPEAAPGLQQQVETRRIMRLTRAVDEGQFQLYAQAIVPLAPEHPARPRCEILLRLPDARGGVETADAFLPQAERHRLMPAIERWVVRQTAAVLGQWHREHPELELPLCAINLSASSLDDADLIPAVREYLTQHRLPPEALCFEIAEAAALGNFAQLVRLISEIRTTGCGVGLDNFGNSLASFAHLKALSVDYVKIGGHYVRGVADDPVYGTLVKTVNEIGRIMGIVTIAEEVENETILEKLRALGVGYAQGHALAPPAPLVDKDGQVALPHVQRSG